MCASVVMLCKTHNLYERVLYISSLSVVCSLYSYLYICSDCSSHSNHVSDVTERFELIRRLLEPKINHLTSLQQ